MAMATKLRYYRYYHVAGALVGLMALASFVICPGTQD